MQTLTNNHEHDFLRYRESLLVDEQTWVAENLDAPLEKPLSYTYRDNELWSEQEQPLGDIFANSVAYYEQLARSQPETVFQYHRSLAEEREYHHMLAMARGHAPNTFVVVSPLPKEIQGRERGMLGYQPKRGLGFLRVMTRENDGSIKMWTHSIDRSDESRVIDAMYDMLGVSVDWSHDVLEQPVALQIDADMERELLGETLLRAGDGALEALYGGMWFAGRNDHDRREAIAFVQHQRDLLHAHVDALIHVGAKSEVANKLRYDFAAAMRRRFEGDTTYQIADSVAVEMAGAGHDAAMRGETADGCGLSISATTAQNLEEAGYKLAPVETPFVKGECVACLKPALVGGCSVCKSCQDLSDQGIDLYEVRGKALHQKALREKRNAQLQHAAERPTQANGTSGSKQSIIKSKFGAHAQIRTELVFGGQNTLVVDSRDGQVIAQL